MSEEALFHWSDDFKIGHERIDHEHEFLFSLLQKLNDIVDEKQESRSATSDALNQLLDYTQTHFRNEEELMQRNNYADFDSHRQSHNKLISQVEDLLEEYQVGEPVMTIEVLLFLKEWLILHIHKDDVQLAQLI